MPHPKRKSKPVKRKPLVRHRSKTTAIMKPGPRPDPRQPALTLAGQLEQVLIIGDLAQLTAEERIDYVKRLCQSLGLNILTRPFDYILFKDYDAGENAPAKLTLYANKSCTEQLRKIHGVGIKPPLRRMIDADRKVVMVEADAIDRTGKTDTATGLVSLQKIKWHSGNRSVYDLTDKEYCNAIMKCETKAKRRATLSICGLGFLDETELDNMRIVGGVTPDGRIYHIQEENPPQLSEEAPHGHVPGSEKAKQAEASLKRVEEEDRKLKEEQAKKKAAAKPAPPAKTVQPVDPKGALEIDWTDAAYPILRGDLSNVTDLLQKYMKTLDWKGDWWHFKPSEVEVIREFAKFASYSLTEIKPPAAPPKKDPPPQAAKPPAEVDVLHGFVEQATEKMTPGKKETATQKAKASVPFISVLFRETGTPIKKHFLTVWDHGMFEFMHQAKAKSCECEFEVKRRGDYMDLVGIRRIGTQQFTDGKIPALSVDREPGNPSLFK